MKRKVTIYTILIVLVFGLMGCTQNKVDTLVMTGWRLTPSKPVLNESVNIHIKYTSYSDTLDKTVLFHWVITEGENQRTYTTLGSDLPITFETPGRKEVLVWVEGVNYGDRFDSSPFYFYFEVPES